MQGADGIPVFFAIFVIVGLVVTILAISQSQQTHQLLERVAQRFLGRVEPGDFWSNSQIRLKFQGYPALLRYKKVGKHSHQTIFTISWPDADLRCELYPQDIFSGFRKLWGMEDIEIGSPQFDAAYFIAGTSRAAVRELLTAEVQAIVFRLASLSSANFFATREIQVQWSGGVLTITKPSRLATFESLEQFISLCGMLFTAALATRNTGIEFIGDGEAETVSPPSQPDMAQAQCQVCGESLSGDFVFCASCETPHHRDCWHYFGGCSTYACGEKKYVEQPKPSRRRKAS